MLYIKLNGFSIGSENITEINLALCLNITQTKSSSAKATHQESEELSLTDVITKMVGMIKTDL